MGASTTSGPGKAGLTGVDTEVSAVLSILHARSSWAGSPVESQRVGRKNSFPHAGGSLITVWLEVRVLPGPPRTLSNCEISRRRPKGPQLAGSCRLRFGLRGDRFWPEGDFGRVVSGLEIPFPDADRSGRRRGSIWWLRHAGRPSIWRWRDHSAGRSRRRATPIPCGSRPSMAALTRSGARKASEIVMLTFRDAAALALCDAFGIGSGIGHEFIEPAAPPRNRCDQQRAVLGADGADVLGRPDSGTRTSRRRVDGVLRHGTSITLRSFCFRLDSAPLASASSMTS